MSATVLEVQSDPMPRKWTRDEYHRAGEAGIFGPDERLELIDGEVIQHMCPIGSPHSTVVHRTCKVLESKFGADFFVTDQRPITLADQSEPEPDIIVALGTVDDYEDHHPTPQETHLVVEVSDSTLAYDRSKKAILYATARIPEYWIVNLPARRLEVYRDPIPAVGYRIVTEHTESGTVSPLFAPDTAVSVADLLPRKH